MIGLRLWLTAISCVATLAIGATTNDIARRSTGMPLTESMLLQAMSTLAVSDPLDTGTLGAALGIALAADGASSNKFFAVFKGRGTAADTIDVVELRTPIIDKTAKGPFVYISLKAQAALTARQVIAQLGPPDELRVPPPQAAATGAAIYVYKSKKARGELRFAIGPAPTESVLSITIDRTE